MTPADPVEIEVRFDYDEAPPPLVAGPFLNALPLHGTWISTEDALRAWNEGGK